MAEESTVAGMGRLLGTNALQREVDQLTKNIGNVNKGLKQAVDDLKATSTTARGRWASTGASQSRLPNGGNASFGGGGRDGNGRYVGAHRVPDSREPADWAARISAGVAGTLGYSASKLGAQVSATTAAQVAVQTSTMPWAAAQKQMMRNNYTAHGDADAIAAFGGLSRGLGYQVGSAQFNTQWNYIKSAGLINPGMTQASIQAAGAGLTQARTYNLMRTMGIQTMTNKGTPKTPRQIAQEILNKVGGRNIRTEAGITANLDAPAGNINVTLQSWVRNGLMPPESEQVVREEIRGILMAQIRGVSYQKYDSLMTTATSNPRSAAGKQATQTLNDMKIGNTSAQKNLYNTAGTIRDRQADLNESFDQGLTATTGTLNNLNSELTDFMNAVPGLTSAIGNLTGSMAGLTAAMPGGPAGLGVAGAAGSSLLHGAAALLGGRALLKWGGKVLRSGPVRTAGNAGSKAAKWGPRALGLPVAGALLGASVMKQGWDYQQGDDQSGLADFLAHTPVGLGGQAASVLFGGGGDRGAVGWINKHRVGGPEGWHEATPGENGMNPSVHSMSSRSASGSGSASASSVIAIGTKYLGMPYQWGGESPQTSFDCSGLMQYIFGRVGIKLPRTAKEQQRVGKPVAKKDLRPGDLVFWGSPAHHVAMVTSPGHILEAPSKGKNVRIRRFSLGEITNARRVLSGGSMAGGSPPEDTAASGSSRLSMGGDTKGDIGFGGISGYSGNYGSVSELSALMAGTGAVQAASMTGGAPLGRNSSSTDWAGGTSDGSVSGNRALGQEMASSMGWTGSQWSALDKLWQRESSWRSDAQNPTSTAYGIAQFLNSTWGPYGKKTSDPRLQIKYGLQYIKDRYGSPAAAWAHSQKTGWYDQGAWSITNDQLARVHKGEMIIPAREAETIRAALLREGNYASKGSGDVILQFGPNSVNLSVKGDLNKTTATQAGKDLADGLAGRLKQIQQGEHV